MTDISPLDALGDPTRRKLFELMRNGPRTVGELVDAVDVSQPAVSQHLAVLRAAGLVYSRKSGRLRLYAVDPTGLGALRAYVEGFWDSVLAAYQRAADELVMENRGDE